MKARTLVIRIRLVEIYCLTEKTNPDLHGSTVVYHGLPMSTYVYLLYSESSQDVSI